MKKQLIFTLFLTAQLFLLTNCKTDVTSIIDDYNTNFIPEASITKHSGPSPGEDDFTQDIMLENEYLVWEDATLNIAAPDNCGTYSWVITDPDDETATPIPVHYFGTPVLETQTEWIHQTLYINIVDSGLTINRVYKLTLTVVGADGRTYTDVAALVVYKHLVR